MSERNPRGPAPDERVNVRELTDTNIEKRIPQPSAAGVAEVPAAMHRPPTLALPPGQTFWLCVIHGLRCFGDRAWSFFIPVYLSLQGSGSSIQSTVMLKMAQTLATTVFAAFAARQFDSGDHKAAATRLLIAENVSVVAGGAALLLADLGDGLWNPLFWVGVGFMSVDAVCSSVLSVVTEKDWVAAVCANDQQALANANALIARVDLFVSIGSYMVMGRAMGWADPRNLLVCLALWHVVSAGAIWLIIAAKLDLGIATTHPTGSSGDSADLSFAKGCATFRSMPWHSRAIMTAFILVWMTILSPGEVVTAWLVSIGTNLDFVANFKAWSQAMGCVSTVVAPMVITAVGAPEAAALGVIVQAVCLLLMCMPGVLRGDAMLLVAGITFSRLGLWTFDLAERQVVQTAVRTADRALLFNCERSICNAATLVALFLATVFSETSQFWVLALFSTVAVSVAAVITTYAVVQHEPTARTLLMAAAAATAVTIGVFHLM